MEFYKSPIYHPRILEDLTTWESDGGDQVVAVNLLQSQESNRYFCDSIMTRKLDDARYPYVYYERDKKSKSRFPDEFTYQYMGQTKNGYYILETWDQGGGSGEFENLLVLSVVKDTALEDLDSTVKHTERILLKKLGQIALGDRSYCKVNIDANRVIVHLSPRIGSDENEETKIINLKYFH